MYKILFLILLSLKLVLNRIEIYNLIGVKVQTAVYDSGDIKLNLAKGAYIVRSGNCSQKIIF